MNTVSTFPDFNTNPPPDPQSRDISPTNEPFQRRSYRQPSPLSMTFTSMKSNSNYNISMVVEDPDENNIENEQTRRPQSNNKRQKVNYSQQEPIQSKEQVQEEVVVVQQQYSSPDRVPQKPSIKQQSVSHVNVRPAIKNSHFQIAPSSSSDYCPFEPIIPSRPSQKEIISQSTDFIPTSKEEPDPFFLNLLQRKQQELTSKLQYSIIHESQNEYLTTLKDTSPRYNDEDNNNIDNLFSLASKKKKKKCTFEAIDRSRSKYRIGKTIQTSNNSFSHKSNQSSVETPKQFQCGTPDPQQITFSEYLLNFESEYQRNLRSLLKRSVRQISNLQRYDVQDSDTSNIIEESEQRGGSSAAPERKREQQTQQLRRFSSPVMVLPDNQISYQHHQPQSRYRNQIDDMISQPSFDFSNTPIQQNDNEVSSITMKQTPELIPNQNRQQCKQEDTIPLQPQNQLNEIRKPPLTKKLLILSNRRIIEHKEQPHISQIYPQTTAAATVTPASSSNSSRTRNSISLNQHQDDDLKRNYQIPPISTPVRVNLANRYFRQQGTPLRISQENRNDRSVLAELTSGRSSNKNMSSKNSGINDMLDAHQHEQHRNILQERSFELPVSKSIDHDNSPKRILTIKRRAREEQKPNFGYTPGSALSKFIEDSRYEFCPGNKRPPVVSQTNKENQLVLSTPRAAQTRALSEGRRRVDLNLKAY